MFLQEFESHMPILGKGECLPYIFNGTVALWNCSVGTCVPYWDQALNNCTNYISEY